MKRHFATSLISVPPVSLLGDLMNCTQNIGLKKSNIGGAVSDF